MRKQLLYKSAPTFQSTLSSMWGRGCEPKQKEQLKDKKTQRKPHEQKGPTMTKKRSKEKAKQLEK